MHTREYVQSILRLIGTDKAQAVHWERFLEHGKEFASFDMKRSLEIAKDYDCDKKACFQNARNVAFSSDFRYFEGMACHIIPVEHAWLVDADGVVIDPTWALLEGNKQADYFGIEMPVKFAFKHYKSERWCTPAWVLYLQQQERRKRGSERNPTRTISH